MNMSELYIHIFNPIYFYKNVNMERKSKIENVLRIIVNLIDGVYITKLYDTIHTNGVTPYNLFDYICSIWETISY